MKRFVSVLIIFALLLSGCAIGQERFKDPVTYFYLRNHSDPDNRDAFFLDGAIGSELREGSGHRNDLNYLLSIYLQGPLDERLLSPFPKGCRIVDIQKDGSKLTVVLSPGITELSEMDVTLACACLAQTCMALSNADTVHIQSTSPDGIMSVSRSFTQDMLILDESYTQTPDETE